MQCPSLNTNLVYMLECCSCKCQYVGETVQLLKDRMVQHRCSAKNGKSGNFRITQHYKQDQCKFVKGKRQFLVYILEKLPGDGRLEGTIDEHVRDRRVKIQDSWAQKLHTMYPYGSNDRLDTLKNKSSYNSIYAQFTSSKPHRKRSWAKSKVGGDCNADDVAENLFQLLNKCFDPAIAIKVKKLFFVLRCHCVENIRELFYERVYGKFELKEMENCQSFNIIVDLMQYKIQPYNECTPPKKKVERVVGCNIRFVSKGVEMLNIPRLFHSTRLKQAVSFCKDKAPLVVYKYSPTISSKLLNYKETVLAYDAQNDSNIVCKCKEYGEFIEQSCGHVVTGNMGIFSVDKLRDVCSKGLSYREPVTIDFNKTYISVKEDVKQFLTRWSTSEGVGISVFNEWFVLFDELLVQQISQLKCRYRNKLATYKSVFCIDEAKRELDVLHKYFVFCSVDKASKNLAIICKRYYIDTLLKECMDNASRFQKINTSDFIVPEHKVQLSKMRLDALSDDLPYMFFLPKFHKEILSQRFVVSYANCTMKPLAQKVTLALKAVQYQIQNYCRMMLILTGIKRYWVIDNNQPIVDGVHKINNTSKARNVTTYDFATLYTNFSLGDIKTAMTSVIKLAFKHSKKTHISVYEKSFRWVNEPRKSTFSFNEQSLIDSIIWILDNSYFKVGNLVFKQLIGVPIGVDCGPFIANLTLFFFENRFLEKQYKVDYKSAVKLNGTYRLIDDITSINSDGYFEKYYSSIYPDTLELKKENTGDQVANVLDLHLEIISDKMDIKLYDKRDDFKFNVCIGQFLNSNISANCAYGIFKSQLTRYFRICSGADSFSDRTLKLVNNLICKGYDKGKLKNIFLAFAKSNNMDGKFVNFNPLNVIFKD